MGAPCASIQIEVTPSTLEYSCDYILLKRHYKSVTSHSVYCVCELHLIPLLLITLPAFPSDSNVPSLLQNSSTPKSSSSEVSRKNCIYLNKLVYGLVGTNTLF